MFTRNYDVNSGPAGVNDLKYHLRLQRELSRSFDCLLEHCLQQLPSEQ